MSPRARSRPKRALAPVHVDEVGVEPLDDVAAGEQVGAAAAEVGGEAPLAHHEVLDAVLVELGVGQAG